MKNSKGITLIALIITIIILIILAAVTMYFAMEKGIFKKAKESSDSYQEAIIREELTIIVANAYMDDNEILQKDTYIIEEAFNKYIEDDNKITVPNFEWTGRVDAIDAFYKGYIGVIDKNTGKILELKKVNFKSTATGKSLDGKSIDEINEEAKTVEYTISGINESDSHNVLYSSYGDKMKAQLHNGSGEFVWKYEEDDIKLAAETYCGNNIMIYDGTSPYVPVMVRFYRQNKGIVGVGNWGGQKLGLEYVAVDTTNMSFSTVNDNNNWAFVTVNWTILPGRTDEELEYDYSKTSDRQCSSTVNGGTSFSDRSFGHYYASGRLTYTGEPTNPITNLGPFVATLYDSKCNVTHTFTTGSNYLIDGRRYYQVLDEAQELLNITPQNAKIATEYHELAKEILKASEESYNYSDPGMILYIMEGHITDIENAMLNLTNALNDLPHISDEVLATVRHAQEVVMSIPTIEVNGGNKVFYTDHETVTDSGSNVAEWTYDKVPQNVQIYCANNILIYDGTDAPYVPVMAKYYRKYVALKSFSSHGLSYLRVNQDTMSFTTCNDNNDWAIVDNLLNDDKAKAYDYNGTSDKKIASNQSSTSSFKDIIAGDRWACGRLIYTGTPTTLLTDLGKFRATSADENGNNVRNIEAPGNNYVINATIYYNKVSEAQQYLTMENLYNNLENTYALAQLINELRNQEYNQTTAQALANKIQSDIDSLDYYINILK